MWFKVILDELRWENKASSSVGLLTTRFLVGFSVFSSCLNRECGSQHQPQYWFTIFSLQVFRKCILGNNGVDAQGSDKSCICNSQNDCSLEKMKTCTMHTCMYECFKKILSYNSSAPLIYSLHVVYLASFHSLGLIVCMKFQCLYLLLLLSLVQKRRVSE